MIDNHYTMDVLWTDKCTVGCSALMLFFFFPPSHPEVREIMQRDIEVKRTDEEEVKEQEQKRQGEETEEKVEERGRGRAEGGHGKVTNLFCDKPNPQGENQRATVEETKFLVKRD